ncbi:MAG: ribonuclease III [Clostridiales bacterium]|jgi:ribonuclease-3|nr:ribonuclease III [Clostridiales bacterium]
MYLEPEVTAPLEKRIQYVFKDYDLLIQALTHSSYANENSEPFDNERLEFLGDSVLQIVVSKILFQKFPKLSEGDLTKLRASIVCEASLAEAAGKIELGRFMRLGNGELQSGGSKRASIISDAMEALFAAVYLDGGFEAAESVIKRLVRIEDLLEPCEFIRDYKTELQVHFQAVSKSLVLYRIVRESGPPHGKQFVAQACHDGSVIGVGEGRTKKEAEQNAARAALKKRAEVT